MWVWKTVCHAAGSQQLSRLIAGAAEPLPHGERESLGGGRACAQILVRNLVQVLGVVARDHERVAPCPRVDVHEGDGVLVLLDDLRRQLARDDLAEQAVVNHHSHPTRLK